MRRVPVTASILPPPNCVFVLSCIATCNGPNEALALEPVNSIIIEPLGVLPQQMGFQYLYFAASQ
ncbi:MAG: hypothetical protein M3530_11000, partial [Thermoproteota archaeon]|nr:hypothetical protein [Thermoproteota archaeon]